MQHTNYIFFNHSFVNGNVVYNNIEENSIYEFDKSDDIKSFNSNNNSKYFNTDCNLIKLNQGTMSLYFKNDLFELVNNTNEYIIKNNKSTNNDSTYNNTIDAFNDYLDYDTTKYYYYTKLTKNDIIITLSNVYLLYYQYNDTNSSNNKHYSRNDYSLNYNTPLCFRMEATNKDFLLKTVSQVNITKYTWKNQHNKSHYINYFLSQGQSLLQCRNIIRHYSINYIQYPFTRIKDYLMLARGNISSKEFNRKNNEFKESNKQFFDIVKNKIGNFEFKNKTIITKLKQVIKEINIEVVNKKNRNNFDTNTNNTINEEYQDQEKNSYDVNNINDIMLNFSGRFNNYDKKVNSTNSTNSIKDKNKDNKRKEEEKYDNSNKYTYDKSLIIKEILSYFLLENLNSSSNEDTSTNNISNYNNYKNEKKLFNNFIQEEYYELSSLQNQVFCLFEILWANVVTILNINTYFNSFLNNSYLNSSSLGKDNNSDAINNIDNNRKIDTSNEFQSFLQKKLFNESSYIEKKIKLEKLNQTIIENRDIIQKEDTELENTIYCVKCLIKPRCVVNECGHLIYCETCVDFIYKCKRCGHPMKDIVKLFRC